MKCKCERMINKNLTEDEIYELIMQLEGKAKKRYIEHTDWEYVLDMLDEDERTDYNDLMGMYNELLDEKGEEE